MNAARELLAGSEPAEWEPANAPGGSLHFLALEMSLSPAWCAFSRRFGHADCHVDRGGGLLVPPRRQHVSLVTRIASAGGALRATLGSGANDLSLLTRVALVKLKSLVEPL